MSHDNPAALSDQDGLRDQLRDALRHLYDGAHLSAHPLADLLSPDGLPAGPAGSKVLRMRLLDAIEALRPGAQVSREADAWRIYDILMFRYVEACSTEEVMQRVHLGHSQYHVEHRKALDALLLSLRGLLRPDDPGMQAEPGRRSLLQRELRQMGGEQESGEVSLNEVLCSVLAMFEPLMAERDVALLCDWRALDTLPPVWGDSTILRQLVVQILGNALRLVRHGRMRLRFESQREGTLLEVTADGALEEGGRIEDWAIRDFGRALGAELGEAREEEGFRLWVQLPIQQRKLVVLIDNDPDLGALFSRYLSGYDWTVVAAQTADEGLRLVRQLKPDAVILDVIMPERDGWQVLSTLRAEEKPGRAPAVIVCSVLEQPELAVSLGADMFLPKPVTQTALLLALQRRERRTTGG